MARAFFLGEFLRLVVAEPRRFAALRGTIAVSAQTPDGPTQKLTVRLGDLHNPVVDGVFDRKADVKLWFVGDAFARFIAGTLPARPCAATHIVQGDAAVLESFGRFVAESAAVLMLQQKKKPKKSSSTQS